MPLASDTRTTFPVLRRGRRLSLRPQGSDACTSQPQRSTSATASHSEQPFRHQIRAATSKSSFHHGQAPTTTITLASQPITQDATAEESRSSSPSPSSAATTPQRRKRRSLLLAAKLKLPRKTPPTPQLPSPLNGNNNDDDGGEHHDLDCPICQDPVGVPNPEGNTEIWGQLHCGHRFGQQCILTWILDSLTQNGAVNPCCPMCREEICHPCGHPLLQIATSRGRGDGDDEGDDTTDEDAEGEEGYELTREHDGGEDELDTRKERVLAAISHMRAKFSDMEAVQRVRGGVVRVRGSTAVHRSAEVFRFLGAVMVLAFKSIHFPQLRLRFGSANVKRNEVALVPPAGYCRRCRDEKEE